MIFDHRRILATAIARLRGKLKYRPVIFELMPPEFTLTDLQDAVEAIAGRHLHKQNFRRLVENAELVEPTGAMAAADARPAGGALSLSPGNPGRAPRAGAAIWGQGVAAGRPICASGLRPSSIPPPWPAGHLPLNGSGKGTGAKLTGADRCKRAS